MELALLIIGGVSAAVFAHTYFIYPLSMAALATLFPKKYRVDDAGSPRLSILVSARNEERVIERTIRRLLECDYDRAKLEILVGSDGSTDATPEILGRLADEFANVRPFVFEKSRGKAATLNELATRARGELIGFCDANTYYSERALRELTKYHPDERVGGVSGELTLVEGDPEASDGSQELRYWDLECRLKSYEGKVGALVGANGGIYWVRRELYSPFPTNRLVNDDFYQAVKVLEAGKDFVYEPLASGVEDAAPSIAAEYRRKTRIQERNFDALPAMWGALNPARGLSAYAFFSHKILRWVSPFFLATFAAAAFTAAGLYGGAYWWAAGATAGAMALSALGWALNKLGARVGVLLSGYYFMMTNVAFIVGAVRALGGKRVATWEPTERRR
jgi:cellulose synthase/poly-beta-1,6-N-acetylglucosamine synthase-like glycosyltransferase